MRTSPTTAEAPPTSGASSLGLGAIIPKVIFNPASDASVWPRWPAAIVGDEAAAEKLIDAIPIIGQVIAVIAAVGDAVTLAEAIGETIECAVGDRE